LYAGGGISGPKALSASSAARRAAVRNTARASRSSIARTTTPRRIEIVPARVRRRGSWVEPAPPVTVSLCAGHLMTGVFRLEHPGLLKHLRLVLHDELVLSGPAPEAGKLLEDVVEQMSFDWTSPSGLTNPIVAHPAKGQGPRWPDLMVILLGGVIRMIYLRAWPALVLLTVTARLRPRRVQEGRDRFQSGPIEACSVASSVRGMAPVTDSGSGARERAMKGLGLAQSAVGDGQHDDGNRWPL